MDYGLMLCVFTVFDFNFFFYTVQRYSSYDRDCTAEREGSGGVMLFFLFIFL